MPFCVPFLPRSLFLRQNYPLGALAKEEVGPQSLNCQEIAVTRVATIKSGKSLIKSDLIFEDFHGAARVPKTKTHLASTADLDQ
jgi:hypothetical protein